MAQKFCSELPERRGIFEIQCNFRILTATKFYPNPKIAPDFKTFNLATVHNTQPGVCNKRTDVILGSGSARSAGATKHKSFTLRLKHMLPSVFNHTKNEQEKVARFSIEHVSCDYRHINSSIPKTNINEK